jgi:hypothetical protein
MSAITTTPCSVTIEVLEFKRIAVLEAGTTSVVASLTAHGLTTGDFFVNITRAAAPSRRFFPKNLPLLGAGRRKIDYVDTNWMGNYYYSIYDPDGGYQDEGDLVALYKFEDKTAYLKDGSFNALLTAQQESDFCSFILETNWTKNVNVFFSDGQNGGGGAGPVNHEWDWDTKTWNSKTGYDYVRYQANAEKVTDNYVFGGNIVIGATTSSGAATATKYNISGDSWSNLTSANDARYNAFSAQIDDVIYWYGGQGPSGGPIEKYEPGSDTWTALTAHGTDYHSGQGSNVGKVLFCNYMATGTNSFETTDILYVPGQDVWANYPVDNSAPSRMLARSGYSLDGFRSQILGGTTNGTASAVVAYNTSANITCKIYSEKTEIPTAAMEGMAAGMDKYSFFGGGICSSSTQLATAYYYTDVRDVWTAIDNLPVSQAQGMGV